MPEYTSITSAYGTLWLHHCHALDYGPDWAQRERLVVDAGASDSQIEIGGAKIPFHGHLFRETDGRFYFSERDRQKYPSPLLDELERIVNQQGF